MNKSTDTFQVKRDFSQLGFPGLRTPFSCKVKQKNLENVSVPWFFFGCGWYGRFFCFLDWLNQGAGFFVKEYVRGNYSDPRGGRPKKVNYWGF